LVLAPGGEGGRHDLIELSISGVKGPRKISTTKRGYHLALNQRGNSGKGRPFYTGRNPSLFLGGKREGGGERGDPRHYLEKGEKPRHANLGTRPFYLGREIRVLGKGGRKETKNAKPSYSVDKKEEKKKSGNGTYMATQLGYQLGEKGSPLNRVYPWGSQLDEARKPLRPTKPPTKGANI